MNNTPTASDTPTPPAVVLRLRPPSACPGSTGWHDDRLTTRDRLLSNSRELLIEAARFRRVSPSLVSAVLAHLVSATKAPGSGNKYAAPGEVCETYDWLQTRTLSSYDQVRRAVRALEDVGALVEVAPAVSPTPKHTTGRAPRRALPWLYDHAHLDALLSGRRVTVEVDLAAVELDPELDLGAPPSASEWGRACATPLVDNSAEDGEWGRAGATHPLAQARPSSVSSVPLVQNLQALTRDVAEVDDSQGGDDAGGEPPMSTGWLDRASELSGLTVDELRSEVLDVWHQFGANLSLLDADDRPLVEYLSTPAERRRELYAPRIELTRRARRVEEPDRQASSTLLR